MLGLVKKKYPYIKKRILQSYDINLLSNVKDIGNRDMVPSSYTININSKWNQNKEKSYHIMSAL